MTGLTLPAAAMDALLAAQALADRSILDWTNADDAFALSPAGQAALDLLDVTTEVTG